MNETSALKLRDERTAEISGPMTLNTVGALLAAGQRVFDRSGGLAELDLAAVDRVDSSGLALLLEWQSRLIDSGCRLRIRNAPDDLVRLARLCDAQELLQLGAREEDQIEHRVTEG